MPPTETLGLMLVRAGKITRAQLYEALKAQRESGQRLGDVLFERGWIDEETLTFLLAKQMDIPFLEARALERVPQGLIEKVPKKLAFEYGVLPVRVWKSKLHVAISDQKTLPYLDELSYFLGRTVSPQLVAPSALRAALEHYYGETPPERAERKAPAQPAPQPVVEPAPQSPPPTEPTPTGSSSDDFAELQARMNEPRAAPRTTQPPVLETDDEGRDFVNIKRADGSETKIFLLTEVVRDEVQKAADASRAESEEPPAHAEEEAEQEHDTTEALEEAEQAGDTAAMLRRQRDAWGGKTQVDLELPRGVVERTTDLTEDVEELEHDEPIPTFDIVRAAETIFSATTPDEIALILVAFTRHLLDRTILFDLRDPQAIRVWKHIDSGIQENFLDDFTATVADLPLLRVVMSTNETFFGPAPSSPMYGAFFEALQMNPPQQILLIPIRALGDTIGVLYGDIVEGGRDEEEFVDLQLLCKEASTGLDMLLSA